MRYIPLILIPLIGGCTSSDPSPRYSESKLLVNKYEGQMSRAEVVNAIKDCESADTRPIMVYSKRLVNGFVSEVVIDVTCAPKWR